MAARKVFLEMNDKTGQLKLQCELYLFSQILIPITEAAITQTEQNRLKKIDNNEISLFPEKLHLIIASTTGKKIMFIMKKILTI